MNRRNDNTSDTHDAMRAMFPDMSSEEITRELALANGDATLAIERALAIARTRRGERARNVGRVDREVMSSGDDGYSRSVNGSGRGSSDYYSNVPPPREDDSLWSWLVGENSNAQSSGNASSSTDETWNWISNQMSYLALEVSRQVKGVTDAIAEEILGPPEEEIGDEVDDITEEERERADVVAGGMAVQANRRTTGVKQDTPKQKTKKQNRGDDDDDDDDALGGILNLLGLEDDLEEDEQYVRRDSKKDK